MFLSLLNFLLSLLIFTNTLYIEFICRVHTNYLGPRHPSVYILRFSSLFSLSKVMFEYRRTSSILIFNSWVFFISIFHLKKYICMFLYASLNLTWTALYRKQPSNHLKIYIKNLKINKFDIPITNTEVWNSKISYCHV